jgi:hypothetical protein
MNRRRRTVRIRLPELSAREAAAISYFIDQLDLALWAVSGGTMTQLCEREGIPLIGDDSDLDQTTVRKRGH